MCRFVALQNNRINSVKCYFEISQAKDTLLSSHHCSLYNKYFTLDFNPEVGKEPRMSSQGIKNLAELECYTRKTVHMQM